MADKSIYERLADARAQFHALKLKKSGLNKFAGYSYFELADFVIPGMDCLRDHGLIPTISFDSEYASLCLNDFNGNVIIFNSPMAEANLKGCHPIQNMGAVQTYQRRYLWMALLEIVEHDALDSAPPAEDEPPAIKQASGMHWEDLRYLAKDNADRTDFLDKRPNLSAHAATALVKKWSEHDAKQEVSS